MSSGAAQPRGLLIGAPGSGSGKTTITLALLRHFKTAGLAVSSVKVGPDYIDPAFHAAASGRPCLNLDSWAMRPAVLGHLLDAAGRGSECVIGEGVMGLFDGAPDGRGSTADLARITGWPVVLVVDAGGMAASAAAVVHGFASLDDRLTIAGVIFNRVGSEAHAEVLRRACAPLSVPVVGMLRRCAELRLPSRHLGLVQAEEYEELQSFLDVAAGKVAAEVDCDAVLALARPASFIAEPPPAVPVGIPPLGQRIAVAQDVAFAFCYPFLLDAWRASGADVTFFSPLADQAPDRHADAVYLPGGYPELAAGRLAGNTAFLEGLRNAAKRGTFIYGECGGYMVLGKALTDQNGDRHAMAGLLSHETSFSSETDGGARRMTLGYREAGLNSESPFGPAGRRFRGHEFHYARQVGEGSGPGIFRLSDSRGRDLGTAGARSGPVMGSFLHLIDRM